MISEPHVFRTVSSENTTLRNLWAHSRILCAAPGALRARVLQPFSSMMQRSGIARGRCANSLCVLGLRYNVAFTECLGCLRLHPCMCDACRWLGESAWHVSPRKFLFPCLQRCSMYSRRVWWLSICLPYVPRLDYITVSNHALLPGFVVCIRFSLSLAHRCSVFPCVCVCLYCFSPSASAFNVCVSRVFSVAVCLSFIHCCFGGRRLVSDLQLCIVALRSVTCCPGGRRSSRGRRRFPLAVSFELRRAGARAAFGARRSPREVHQEFAL